jgi:peptidase E
MEARFILHGGASSKRTKSNEKFFSTIVDNVEKEIIKILCVYFARPEHRWDESFYEDRHAFESLDTTKTITVEMATYENFKTQVENYDVILINGGFKGHLKEVIQSMDNFKDLIKGKIVVGVSAGANILSTYYYSHVIEGIREGSAILPIKVFCHFEDTLVTELKMLEQYKEELPIYKIPEESFVVLSN